MGMFVFHNEMKFLPEELYPAHQALIGIAVMVEPYHVHGIHRIGKLHFRFPIFLQYRFYSGCNLLSEFFYLFAEICFHKA